MEKVLDIKNLFYRMLTKWYVILIVGLVLAVGYDLFSVLRSKGDAEVIEKVSLEEKIEEKKAQLEDTEKVLTADKKDEVMVVYDTYLRMHEVFVSLEKYYDGSIYMKIDHNNVPVTTLQYKVDNHFTVEYPEIDKKDFTLDIMSMFTSAVTGDEAFTRFDGMFGGKYDDVYIMELIGAYQKSQNTFNIDIYGLDKEMCDTIADDIEKKIDKYYAEVKKVYGDFDLTLQSRLHANHVNNSVLNNQQSTINELNNLRSSWQSLSGSLIGAQKTYYTQLVELKELNDEEESLEEEEEAPEAQATSYIQPKKLVLGFLLGAVLSVVIIFAFVFRPSVIYTKESLDVCYEPSVIANINVEKKRGIVAGLLTKLFYRGYIEKTEDESKQVLVNYVNVLAAKKDIKKLVITGSCAENDRMKDISSKLKIDKVTVCENSADAVASYADADAVLFVETLGVARFENVYDELLKASQAGVEVIGFTTISNL